MKERPFQLFIDLVSFDQEIRLLRHEIETIEHEIVKLEIQHKEVIQKIETAKNRVVAIRKKVGKQELELKELDQLERDKKQLLDRISNYKEYQSVKAEVESAQQAQLGQEQAVLEAWNDLETAQKVVKNRQEEHDKKVASLKKAIRENRQKIELLQSSLTSYEQKRPKKEKIVPKEWLEKYTIMKARVSNPVVSITQGACSACFYALTNQGVICAKKGRLLQCKGCYRLLYLLEAMKKDDSQ